MLKSAWGGTEKRDAGSKRTRRRVVESGLAGSGRGRSRDRDAERPVFVDEMGTNTSLAPLCAWSRRGERARATAPRNWGANVTLLASMGAEGMGPCLAVEGSTTREVFEAYL